MTIRGGRRGRALPLPVLAVDQGLYAASNFGIAAAAGRALDAPGFGRFAALLLVISITVNLVRAVWHEPDLVATADRRAGWPGPGLASLAAVGAIATLIAFGPTLGDALPGAGAGAGGSSGSGPVGNLLPDADAAAGGPRASLLDPALGEALSDPGSTGLPGVDGGRGVEAVGLGGSAVVGAAALLAALTQDRARYRALAAGRLWSVVAGDGAWLLVVGAGLVGLVPAGSPSELLRLWLLGAVVGLVPPLLATTGRTVSERTVAEGTANERTVTERTVTEREGEAERRSTGVAGRRRFALLTDALLLTGMTQIGGLGLALVLVDAEFAQLRGAIILLGPIGVLIGAVTTWIFSSVEADERAVGAVAARAVAMAGLGLAVTTTLAVVPDRMGSALLGSGWPDRAVLVPIALSVSCQALSTPAMMLLRLLDERRQLLLTRLGGVVAFVATTATLAILTGSAAAVAGGYLVTNAGLAAAVWLGLRERAHPPEPAAERERQQPRSGQSHGQPAVRR